MAEYDLKALESLLVEVKKFAVPRPEPTIFAVGGRGYYENPASDLLAFFLKPDAAHGLGDLFLSTFLTCMEDGNHKLDLNQVDIQREVQTDDGKFIDIQIIGSDWCLLIENKIRHWDANPFTSYEAHAKKLVRGTKLFAVLSPSGKNRKEGKTENWKGVSYPIFCKALQGKLKEINCYEPRSKWWLLARELILHLLNELYNPIMTPAQSSFVEQHAAELIEARKLLNQYPEYICKAVKEALEKQLGYEVTAHMNWAIIIRSPEKWGIANIALRLPIEVDRTDRTLGSQFDLSIYPENFSLKNGHCQNQPELLHDLKPSTKHSCWMTAKGFMNYPDAVKFIVSRVKLVER